MGNQLSDENHAQVTHFSNKMVKNKPFVTHLDFHLDPHPEKMCQEVAAFMIKITGRPLDLEVIDGRCYLAHHPTVHSEQR